MIKLISITFTLLFLFPVVVNAHSDRFLSLKEDGLISEIPESFGAVYLNIKDLGAAEPKIRFKVGENEFVVPQCVAKHIKTTSKEGVSLVGSWYHDQKILPYYVSVKFSDPKFESKEVQNAGVNLLFNLNTTQLMRVNRFRYTSIHRNSTPIELEKDCRDQIPELAYSTQGKAFKN